MGWPLEMYEEADNSIFCSFLSLPLPDRWVMYFDVISFFYVFYIKESEIFAPLS